MSQAQISGTETPQRRAQLGAEVFDLLFAGCQTETYRAGHHLFMQEDVADRVYGVVRGTVEIAIFSLGGRKLVANFETPKSMIGEIAVLDGGERTATATCLTDCELVSLSRNRVFERIEQNPKLAVALIELLCARLSLGQRRARRPGAAQDRDPACQAHPLPERIDRRCRRLDRDLAVGTRRIPGRDTRIREQDADRLASRRSHRSQARRSAAGPSAPAARSRRVRGRLILLQA